MVKVIGGSLSKTLKQLCQPNEQMDDNILYLPGCNICIYSLS